MPLPDMSSRKRDRIGATVCRTTRVLLGYMIASLGRPTQGPNLRVNLFGSELPHAEPRKGRQRYESLLSALFLAMPAGMLANPSRKGIALFWWL